MIWRKYKLGHAVLWVGILAFSLHIRIAPLDLESLEGDELFTRRAATAPGPKAWEMIRNDLVHPPLYYCLLRMTLAGTAEPGDKRLRGLSLAAGAGAIAVIAAMGATSPYLRFPAILSALLVSLNESHVFYSQQARSYALYTLLVAFLLLWRALEQRFAARRIYWAAGAVVCSALVWTHYVGALYCLACAVSMIRSASTPFRRRILPLLPPALAALAILPWLIPELGVYRSVQGLGRNLDWQGTPSFYDLRMTLASYSGIPDFPGGTTFALALGLTLGGAALFRAREWAGADAGAVLRTLAWTACLPPLVLWLVARKPFDLPVFGGRHLLPSLLPATLLVSIGAYRLASFLRSTLAQRLAFAAAALLLCALQSAALLRSFSGPARTPFRKIVEDIRRLHPGLTIYHTNPGRIGDLVEYYSGRPPYPVQELPNTSAMLPADFLVLYRPAVPSEKARVEGILRDCRILSSKYYAGARSPRYGTLLVVLSRTSPPSG